MSLSKACGWITIRSVKMTDPKLEVIIRVSVFIFEMTKVSLIKYNIAFKAAKVVLIVLHISPSALFIYDICPHPKHINWSLHHSFKYV